MSLPRTIDGGYENTSRERGSTRTRSHCTSLVPSLRCCQGLDTREEDGRPRLARASPGNPVAGLTACVLFDVVVNGRSGYAQVLGDSVHRAP